MCRVVEDCGARFRVLEVDRCIPYKVHRGHQEASPEVLAATLIGDRFLHRVDA